MKGRGKNRAGYQHESKVALFTLFFISGAAYMINPDTTLMLLVPYIVYLYKVNYVRIIFPVLYGLFASGYFMLLKSPENFFVHFLFCMFCLLVEWLDPEPFFLLSLHTIVSCLMLHDAPTTMAAIMAVVMTCMTTGSMDVSSDRIAVFIISMAITSLLGTMTAAIAAILLIVAIVTIKLRPLRPASNSVLVLLLLAASAPINTHVTAALSAILVVIGNIYYIIWRIRTKTEMLYLEHNGEHHNNNNNNTSNNNSSLHLMNGGHLKLCSTTDSLDLHGHTVTSALKTLHQFLKEHEDSYRTNRTGHTRYLKIITGEDGKNHPEDNMNLVKPTVANFLKINKYRFQAHPDRPGILKVDLESHVK